MTIEHHPLEPFLPPGATTLFLGSFPPPRERWSMDFFYPNYINDFWRVMGLIHFGEARWFEIPDQVRNDVWGDRNDAGGVRNDVKGVRKGFDRERIVAFCEERGLAFFDTATVVKRLKDNASDAFLEVLEPTDVGALLARIPRCRRLVTTGGKASEELADILSRKDLPPIGGFLRVQYRDRELEWWRMPSTSRAYPLALAKKADFYRRLF
jgi:G:T/U-mismatch repair DNA glycosylase